MPKTQVLLLSGRYLAENPYRELQIKKALESMDCNVTYAVPSKQLNLYGYPDEMKEDKKLQSADAVWLDNFGDFEKIINRTDVFLCGSWKNYHLLVDIAHKHGVFTANYMSTGGADHWPNGADHINAKSRFDKQRLLSIIDKTPHGPSRYTPTVDVTGGVVYDSINRKPDPNEREEVCDHYDVDADQPIIVLFPKGIGSFRSKVSGWFKDFSEEECAAYAANVEKIYQDICAQVSRFAGQVFIKMHPTAYVSYMCNEGEEYDFWRAIPNTRIIAPQHNFAFLRNMDIGVGVTTHAAMDANLFRKPFVYVDSKKVRMPNLSAFHTHGFCELHGPSSDWDLTDKPNKSFYLPAWAGTYSDSEHIRAALDWCMKPLPGEHYDRVIDEFWGDGAQEPSQCIASSTLAAYQEHINSVRSTGFIHKMRRGFRTLIGPH